MTCNYNFIILYAKIEKKIEDMLLMISHEMHAIARAVFDRFLHA